MSDGAAVVYRLFDGEGGLLYVGCTTMKLEARLQNHRMTKPWWSEVADVRVEEFATREAALAAESDAIFAEQPRHNITGKAQGEPRLCSVGLHQIRTQSGACRECHAIRKEIKSQVNDALNHVYGKLPSLGEIGIQKYRRNPADLAWAMRVHRNGGVRRDVIRAGDDEALTRLMAEHISTDLLRLVDRIGGDYAPYARAALELQKSAAGAA